MKKQFLFCLAFCSYIMVFNIYGQSAQLLNSSTIENEQVKSYKIDASERLENFSKALGIDYSRMGKPANNLLKTSAWNFTVGSQKNWNASDLSSGSSSFYSVPSTCRKVGTNCYIFVEDAVWTNGRVTIDAVNKVAEAFDSKTPANPAKGIYLNNVEAFGNVPNVDGDAKIIILILDIKDGYDPQKGGGYIAGYFHGYHQYLKSQGAASSNEAEIYFLDANPVNLLTDSGVNSAMSTTAHEFQHMIHFNYLPAAETFLNEAWSLIAEVLNGYPLYSQSGYQGETNTYLLGWRRDDATAVLRDYSRAAKFALYLKEQIGTEIFKKYLENKVSGLPGLSNVMTIMGYSRTLSEVINDWFIANALNNKTINSKWGYTYTPISKMQGKLIINPNQTENIQFSSLSSQYYTFSSGKNLKCSVVASDPSAVKAVAIKYNATGAVVEDIPNISSFSFADFGTTYNKITLVFSHSNVNTSNSGNLYTLSLTSTGDAVSIPASLLYTNSLTYYKFNSGVNNYVTGTNSYKIRGLYQRFDLPGTANAKEIYYYFGAKTITGTADKIDFTIRTVDQNGAPGQVIYTKAYTTNDFLLPASGTAYPTSFSLSPTVSVPSSYFAGLEWDPAGDDIFVLLSDKIDEGEGAKRAWWFENNFNFASIDAAIGGFNVDLAIGSKFEIPSAVEEKIELPAQFSLAQNYPNPFNPSTVIKYNLPKAEFVTLKVYDLIGKEIATLVNEYQQAGVHNSQFSIINSQLASGIYFYTINAGNFNQTKKMILIK